MKKLLSLILVVFMLLSGVSTFASTTDVDTSDLWLTDEKITFSFWWPFIQDLQLGDLADPNEADVFQWLESVTNVHIDWIIPPASAMEESYTLLFAGDRMPDIVYSAKSDGYMYAGGPEAAVDDGYFLRLNELMDEYAPNYEAILNRNERIAKDCATDSGLRWGFYFIYNNENGKGANYGPCIRQDYLDELGLDIPVTYDDWHTVLTRMKNELGVEYPLFVEKYGNSRYSEWSAGYGVGRDFYQDNGMAKFGPIEDGYGEFLDMMTQWYKEGLIYADFALESDSDSLRLPGRIAAWCDNATCCGSNYYLTRGATDDNFNLVGTPIPVQNVGDAAHLRIADTIVNQYILSVSTDCEYPEIAVKWIDIFYNMLYNNIFNYGIREGESYVVNEDGSLSWGPLIMENQEGLTVTQARMRYTMSNAPLENYTRVMGSWNETQLFSQQNWLKSFDDGVISDKLTMTAEEGDRQAAIMGDIRLFVEEESAKIIMGTSNYTFETFREKINSMNIAEALEIEQAALDRYNAR